jgi:aminoglycoside phosphotransferase family enzyme/predicted kinase
VTRDAGGRFALNGDGEAVEWLVEMVRFDEETLFDRLAARGALPLSLMEPLAAAIAAFHAGAERVPNQGGRAGLAWVVDGNEAGLADQRRGVFEPAAAARLIARTRLELDRQGGGLDVRRNDGLVRRCHGDLHLRNICLLDGRPTLFDCVEFNDAIACVDVFYDLAFLLMDLWRRDLPAHANTVFNVYLQQTGDFAALPALPLFLSCRAAVRAKTSATAAAMQSEAAAAEPLRAAAREYLAMADRLLQPAPPRLVAIGGLSGSGKSAIARALAPAIGRSPGAVIVGSDRLRKEMLGVDPLTRLDEAGYTPAVSARVYATLCDRAALVLRAGQSVVAEAVFGREEDRLALERLAAEMQVGFDAIWLEAPVEVLADRISGRTGDVSDATVEVLQAQAARDLGALSWRRVDAVGDLDVVRRRVEAALRL